MSITYKVVKQCEPGIKGGGTGKYYARACNRDKLSLEQICKQISKASTFSPADVVGVLYSFINLFPDLLKGGYTLDLEPLGIFSVSIKSKGEPQPDKVTSRSITGVQVNFRPSVRLKKEIKDAGFIKNHSLK